MIKAKFDFRLDVGAAPRGRPRHCTGPAQGPAPTILFVLLLFIFSPYQPAIANDPNSIYFGAAKVEMTPAVGTPLAGFGKRKGKPSTGVHDPLFARAIALTNVGAGSPRPESGRGNLAPTYVFISADLVLVDEKMRKSVLKKIRKKRPLRDEELMLFATHTHSGAGAIGGRFWERFIMGKFRKNVFESVTNAIVQAALQAMDEKIPVKAEYGEANISSLIENRMDERMDIEDKLRVLRFIGSNNSPVGFLVMMAAHPTMLGASNREFSADFPGALSENLEEKFPGAVAVFANGAAGDLRPHYEGFSENRFEKMGAYGFKLAEEVERIHFESAPLNGNWNSVIEKVRLPRTKIRVGFLRIPSILGNRVFPRKSYFQIVRLGSFLFLGFPGEMASETGLEIESRMRAKFFEAFVIGYANDYIGYVVPRRHWKNKDHYESTVSFYGAKSDWFVQKTYDRLFEKLVSPEERAIGQPAGLLQYKEGLPVLKLRGDAYHVGFEEGRLLKPQIHRGVDDIFRYFRKELPIPLLNRLIIHWISGHAWKKMEPFVSYDEYLQMKGISDGSGVPFRKIKRIHAMPELYPTFCSNGAYWGSATEDGRLIAIRNLDWNRKMGIHQHAAVKAIKIPGRLAYANVGYYGFAGVLSGINEKGISVGQVGSTSLDETMEGVPMPFALKRILETADDVEDAIQFFQKVNRTRGYNFVIADALDKKAVTIESTRNHLAWFYDADEKEKVAPYSLLVENAVFRGDPAIDPTIRNLQWASKGNPKKEGFEMPAGSAYEIRYLKHGRLVEDHYGKINPEIAKTIANEIAPNSNIQSVIYAFPDFWVANAEGDKKAAESRWIKFHWDELTS